MFFPFFFSLKKEKQIAICLACFVCVHVYAGIAWGGGGAESCNEAKPRRRPLTGEP